MPAVDVTVYYLEMLGHTPRAVPSPLDCLSVVHAKRPTVGFYRFLYNTVGEAYNWQSRANRSDAELAALIQDPLNEVHVLYVDGTPAGFAELDRRTPGDIELIQFGLVAEFIGRGLGKWFLQWTIDQVWSYQPRRFWLHTCTLDHPVALSNYQKAGFTLFKQEVKPVTLADRVALFKQPSSEADIQLGRYRHYKGKEYLALGVARHSETDEDFIIYRQDYGDRGLWLRPKKMFQETVQVEGQALPRFRYIAPE
jgi:hypothetical protein